jgi:hypothetical protein
MVCRAGSRAGDIHGNLDSFHLWIWNLLQAGHIDGQEAVMSINLLQCGIFVFVLLLIGLGLTVMEFRNMK